MTRTPSTFIVAVAATALAAESCGGDWEVSDGQSPGDDDGSTPCLMDTTPAGNRELRTGLRVVGNEIHDASGQPVILRGVNRSGTEYRCVEGKGFFDGPGAGSDAEQSVRAIASWNVNAVRVPLNEACWLSLGHVLDDYSGANYKAAIRNYVELLQEYGIVPILDLHWAAPGDIPATRLQPMPNLDYSPDFWADVARTFMDNTGVIFEVYNEPYPDFNQDTEAAWSCWRDGCEATVSQFRGEDGEPLRYAAAGMQTLVDAIRETGSSHVILLGGVQYSNALTGWLEYRPNDPLAQLGAAWHVYNFNACRDLSCWSGVPAGVAREVPVVATEVGQNDCEGDAFLSPLLEFLDGQGSGYLAWSWNAYGACQPEVRPDQAGQPWPLIRGYACPEPNSNYARTYYEHLKGAVP